MTSNVRTRFAPSPTGFLHLGGARTALFSWAFARHFKGTFVLRVEDTDVERSTPEAVQAILDGMQWLDLAHDEGPFFQMQHMDRYRAVIQEMLAAGTAYYCYSTPEEVEAMREKAMALGQKPRYDGTWRPEPGKTLPDIPADRKPVVRFRNPQEGVVTWEDMVKGSISIANAELDDLIIARPDGTPTYNFCVVVDDWDMRITHVIRGDDHVNNTPRQINILQALGATLPIYGHVPMILGPDGQKLSKRHGAVSVMQYDTLGYLPEAMLNYLGRLGWSHQDDELFTMEQMVAWFDGTHLSRSAAQWDPKKLNWVNAHYLKTLPVARIKEALLPRLEKRQVQFADSTLEALIELYRERVETLEAFADALTIFADAPIRIDPEAYEKHITEAIQPAIAAFCKAAEQITWEVPAIQALIKQILQEFGLKMPQLAIPLRVLVAGVPQTPSIEPVLFLMGKELVLKRLRQS